MKKLICVFAGLVLAGCGVMGAQEGDTLLLVAFPPDTPWEVADEDRLLAAFGTDRPEVKGAQLSAPDPEDGDPAVMALNLTVDLADPAAQELVRELCDYPDVIDVSSAGVNKVGQPIDEQVLCSPG